MAPPPGPRTIEAVQLDDPNGTIKIKVSLLGKNKKVGCLLRTLREEGGQGLRPTVGQAHPARPTAPHLPRSSSRRPIRARCRARTRCVRLAEGRCARA